MAGPEGIAWVALVSIDLILLHENEYRLNTGGDTIRLLTNFPSMLSNK